MTRRKTFTRRPSLRESLESSQRGQNFYAAMAGKPPVEQKWLAEIGPKRTRRAAGSSHRPLERDVLKVIVQALRLDRRVARVSRNQSGLFQEGNRYIRVGVRGQLDLTVFMKPGISPAWGEIECKRDEKAKPAQHQLARIERIRREGGFSGWAWSVESALALLP